ncbi:unnamed protein product [Gordionus sp. m RMFG-2023]
MSGSIFPVHGFSTSKITTEGYQNLPMYGKGSNYNRNDADRLARKLVLEGFLREKLQVSSYEHVVSYVNAGPRYLELVSGNVKVEMALPKKLEKKIRAKNKCENIVTENNDIKNNQLDIQTACFKELLELCKTLGKELKTSYINILSADALREMSRMLPTTKEELKQITGMGAGKLAKFGGKFLDVILRYHQKLQEYEKQNTLKKNKNIYTNPTTISPYFDSSKRISNKESCSNAQRKKSVRSVTTKKRSSGDGIDARPSSSTNKGFKRKFSKGPTYGFQKKKNWKKMQGKKSTANSHLMPFPNK